VTLTREVRWLLGAALVSVALIVVYVAAGGLDYKPAAAPDPCRPRNWPKPNDFTEQAAISALDGAACELGVSREQLGLVFTSKERLKQFQKSQGFSDQQIQDAARDGVLRAVDDAERAGEIGGLEATALRVAAQLVPVDRLIQLVQQGLGT
jgi:hypothetical protein